MISKSLRNWVNKTFIIIINKIGEGAYSTVYKVKRLVDGNVYALKKVKLLNLSEKEKLNALNEVRILASVKSNFVISYKEAFFDDKDSTLGIVMEYADSGDLYQKIVEHKKAAMFFEESDIWRIFIQLVKGLKALHDLKILHRDLKSANVFLESDGSAKLGDLNVSKVARRGLGYTQTGTPYYASPEVWKDQPYDNKSDIWSLGCVLYEMITLRPPFRAENMEGLYNKVIKGQFSKIPDRFSNDLQTIVKLLIQVSPNDRPSCERILKHPIIQNRIEYFKAYANDEVSEDQALLQTIRIPKNLLFLSDKLPRPNYEKHNNSKQMKNYRSFTNNRELEVKNPIIKANTSNVGTTEKTKITVSEREGAENVSANSNINPNNVPINISVIKKREVSPKQRIELQSGKRRNMIIENNVQIKKSELPQLNIISSNRKSEQSRPNPIQKNKIMNYNRNNQHLNDLYKIYAPYLNNPALKQVKRYNNDRLRPNNINYLNNLEKYYNNIHLYNKNKHSEGPERKVLPKRKLSPIRRKIINIY